MTTITKTELDNIITRKAEIMLEKDLHSLKDFLNKHPLARRFVVGEHRNKMYDLHEYDLEKIINNYGEAKKSLKEQYEKQIAEDILNKVNDFQNYCKKWIRN